MRIAREWRTFKTIIWRNLKLFTAYKAWVIATILWPIPLLALNIYTYRAFGDWESLPPGLAGMIIVGTIVYLLYNRLLWGTGTSIQRERWMGTIEVLFLTPTNKMTILLASGVSSLLEASWWIVCIFLISGAIFGIQPNMTSWLAVVISLLSTMLTLVAVGVFFGGFFVLTRAADQLASALQAPIRFFSGVGFNSVFDLPGMLLPVAFILPVTYGVLVMRESLLRGGDLGVLWVWLVPLYVMSAVFLVLGYFTLKEVERRAKKKGTLYLF